MLPLLLPMLLLPKQPLLNSIGSTGQKHAWLEWDNLCSTSESAFLPIS
jgi:hypothetical protein